MKVNLKPNSSYQITFEWIREGREVTTQWLSAEEAKNLIDLCNSNPIKIYAIEEWAA